MTPHRLVPSLIAAVLLTAVPGRAADLDRFLPEDSEAVLNLNVRQILDSELIKKHVLAVAQEALRGNDQVQDILKDLGFDPFKDLDRILVATPGGTDKDRGLLIAHGRFDVAKFKAKGESVANDNGDVLKIHKVLGGKHLIYEVNHPDLEAPFFVALAGKDTILASPGKDYVVDALKKIGKQTKPVMKNKDLQALLEKVNDRQSFWMAGIKDPAVKDAIGDLPENVKGMIDKIQAIAGGLTISDEIKLEFVFTTKDGKEAKDLQGSIDAGLKLALFALAGLSNQKDSSPQMNLLLEFVKGLRVSSKEQAVVLKGRISSDLIEDTLKKDK